MFEMAFFHGFLWGGVDVQWDKLGRFSWSKSFSTREHHEVGVACLERLSSILFGSADGFRARVEAKNVSLFLWVVSLMLLAPISDVRATVGQRVGRP